MSEILLMGHEGLAQLALLATFGWAALVASPAAGSAYARFFYALAMAATGLVGVTGIVLVFTDGWAIWVFPWVGLALILAHGIAGVRSRRDIAANRRRAVLLSAAQVVFLAVAYALMTVKPF